MLIPCIFEHNGNDTLLWAEQLPGSFTRGKSLDEAQSKMDAEIRSFCKWAGKTVTEPIGTAIVQEKESTLQVRETLKTMNHIIRGQKVMLAADLAEINGYSTKA